MTEALFITLVFLLGLLALLQVRARLAWPLVLSAALPTGSLFWMFVVILIGMVGGEVRGKELVLGVFLLAGAALAIIWWQRGRSRSDAFILIIAMAVVFAIVFAATLLEFDLYHTGDSFLIRDLGKLWLRPSYEFDTDQITELRAYDANPPVKHMLAAYGFLLPAIHAPDFINYFRTFTPLFSLSLTITMGILLWRLLPGKNKRLKSILLAGVATILLSTFFYLLNSFYVHTNLLAAGYLALAVLSFLIYMRSGEDPYFYFSLLMFTGFSFSRTESSIIVLAVVPLMLATHPVPTKLIHRGLIPMFTLVGLWHLYILWDLQSTGISRADVLSPLLAGVVAGAYFAGVAVLVFWQRVKSAWLKQIPGIILFGLVALVLLAVLFAGGIKELWLVLVNVFFYNGAWGPAWALVSVAWLVFPTRDRSINLIAQLIVVNLCMVLLAGMLAGNYRLGWSDSGNRMMLQVFFLALIGAALRVYSKLLAETKRP